MRGNRLPAALAAAIATSLVGCCDHRTAYVPTTRPVATGLPAPTIDPLLHAAIVPPIGWRPDPLKLTAESRHQVWISPGKGTAYGVLAFHMPLPVGSSLAMIGVLRKMKEKEGDADLLDQRDDDSLPGIRFVVNSGPYTVRGNLSTDGRSGWVVYAGTLRRRTIDQAELKLAEQAREATRVALP